MQTPTYPKNVKNSQGWTSDSAFVYNQGIVTQREFEAYEKQVNEIYLRTLAIGEYYFSVADSVVLYTISSLCPALGGKAVFKARTLLRFLNDTLYFDDDSLCVSQGVLYRQAQVNENHERSSVSDLSVYPNPSSGIINIEFVEWNNDEYYVLELYSSIGKRIDKILVQSKSTQLDLSKYQLGTGLLLYRCYNSKGVVINTGKISYIKH